MVAYGEELAAAARASPYGAAAYLDYEALKDMLYELETLHLREPVEENALSLTVTPATNAAAMPLQTRRSTGGEGEGAEETAAATIRDHEAFLRRVDTELKKMDAFTHEKVVEVRREVRAVEQAAAAEAVDREALAARAAACGDAFLDVERYVNVNVTGVRKLLKKHDKVLPERPCAAFYTARMHDMRWIRHDYSDVVVRLSRLSAVLDPASVESGVGFDDETVKATTKYWVPPNKLSQVKLALSRHLPVVLEGGVQPTSPEKVSSVKDSQLVNTVYLDSPSLELYHGRLAKQPGAVALRIRWYGDGEPRKVFVERKTHRDAWAGDESVKDRFAMSPDDVPLLLKAAYDPAAVPRAEYTLRELRVVDEVQRLISTKKLVPTVRSQCYRAAFRRADTTAVRAAIDTNLRFITEVPSRVNAEPLAATSDAEPRWYRGAATPVPEHEVTRFPFAVLELKLALDDADDMPAWVEPVVADLIPVHKFSKYIHGCAVLLPDEVQAAPYWIDDPALGPSKPQTPLRRANTFGNKTDGAAALVPVPRAWHDGESPGPARIARAPPERVGCLELTRGAGPYAPGRLCEPGACVPEEEPPAGLLLPKDLLANERTFVHWVHAAVIVLSFGSAAFAFADSGRRFLAPAARARAAAYGTVLCLGSVVLVVYAVLVYRWRARHLKARDRPEWNEPEGPLLVSAVAIFFLASAWIAEVRAWLFAGA